MRNPVLDVVLDAIVAVQTTIAGFFCVSAAHVTWQGYMLFGDHDTEQPTSIKVDAWLNPRYERGAVSMMGGRFCRNYSDICSTGRGDVFCGIDSAFGGMNQARNIQQQGRCKFGERVSICLLPGGELGSLLPYSVRQHVRMETFKIYEPVRCQDMIVAVALAATASASLGGQNSPALAQPAHVFVDVCT